MLLCVKGSIVGGPLEDADTMTTTYKKGWCGSNEE